MFDNIVLGFFGSLFDMQLTLIAQAFDWIFSLVYKNLGYDCAEFLKSFPVMQTVYEIFAFTGIALGIILLVYGIFKSMWGPIAEQSEHPGWIVGRFVLFGILMWQGYNIITKLIFKIFELPLTALRELDESVGVGDKSFLELFNAEAFPIDGIDGIFEGVGQSLTMALESVVASLFLIVIVVKLVKLIIELFERYCLLNVLVFTSPLVYPTVVSKGTSKIFNGWCKMLAGQIILILFNTLTLKVLNNAIYAMVERVTGGFGLNEFPKFVFGFMMIIAFMNIAQRFDTYLNQIGINVGITGGGLFGEALMAFNQVGKALKMGKNAGHSIGNAAKGIGKGAVVIGKGAIRGVAAASASVGAVKYAMSHGHSASEAVASEFVSAGAAKDSLTGQAGKAERAATKAAKVTARSAEYEKRMTDKGYNTYTEDIAGMQDKVSSGTSNAAQNTDGNVAVGSSLDISGADLSHSASSIDGGAAINSKSPDITNAKNTVNLSSPDIQTEKTPDIGKLGGTNGKASPQGTIPNDKR